MEFKKKGSLLSINVRVLILIILAVCSFFYLILTNVFSLKTSNDTNKSVHSTTKPNIKSKKLKIKQIHTAKKMADQQLSKKDDIVVGTQSMLEQGNEPTDELNEAARSDIKTIIYRSTDPSTALLEEQATDNIETSIENDIINKDQLLRGSKGGRAKIIKRELSRFEKTQGEKRNIFLPWFVSILLFLFLLFIFKFLLQKKL